MKVDLLVHAPHMYTMAGEGLGYRCGESVAVDRGKIVAAGPREALEGAYTAERTVEGRHHVLLPGFVDCHMHTRHAVYRGVAQDITNWMWGGVAPFEAAGTPAARLAGSRLAMAEALMSGTTTVGDDGPDLIGSAETAAAFGLRANLSPRIREVDMGSYGPGELYRFFPGLGQESLDACLNLFDRFHNYDNGRIRVLFGPQGADFLSRELMVRVCRMAREVGTRVHMHFSQGSREDEQIQLRHHMRPVAYLNSLGVIDENLIAVHLTSATEEEVALTARRGASMIFCPSSIGVIDGEVPPAKIFLDHGGLVGLGSDQSPGNNNHNMFNEMKLAAVLNKCKYGSPLLFPAWKVLRMATIEGARAIGLGDVTGSIEPGKAADLILIDLRQPSLSPVITSPMRNIAANIVYAGRGHEVDTVIAAGKLLMEHRRPLTFDLDEVLDSVQQEAEALAERATPRFQETNSIIAEYMRNDQL